MYHDQVLTPIKTLFKFKAINVTVGLPFVKVTPDHGPNQEMIGKNISDPSSIIYAFKFLNKLEIVIISNNLGDAKSIATHPATTTHQRLTEKQKEDLQISEGLIRLSVGLEDTNDLINDVSSALRTL